ncbi:MAG TPA: GIY-YIG nuclease family protein [Candidatus Acidoferrum sp.]|nr:GIY-YIG nuclease family protein [Candidatus Acidoferrum sp.]
MKGIYVLIVEISKTITVNIGAFGLLTFPSGLYAYVGSAQNNLELRVKRHLSKQKRLFWHIDYLLSNEAVKMIGAYYKEGDKTKECKIARLLHKNALSIAGFGCSDCQCESHLFQAKNFDFLTKCMQPIHMEHLNQ